MVCPFFDTTLFVITPPRPPAESFHPRKHVSYAKFPVLQLQSRCRFFETVPDPTQHKCDPGSGWFPPFQIKILLCSFQGPVMPRFPECFRTGAEKLSTRCSRTAESYYQPSTWPLSSAWTTGNGSMTPSSPHSLTCYAGEWRIPPRMVPTTCSRHLCSGRRASLFGASIGTRCAF